MGSVAYNKTISTQSGINQEITINLVLTIKLDSDDLKIAVEQGSSASNFNTNSNKSYSNKDDDEVDMIIPTFKSEEIIPFGQKVEEIEKGV